MMVGGKEVAPVESLCYRRPLQYRPLPSAWRSSDFFDGRRGAVLARAAEIHREQADVMLGAVREVNSGKLTPEAARVVVAKQLAEMQPKPAPG